MDERDSLEREIADALAAGEHDNAVTTAIRGYGPEVLGFLCAHERDEARANEAFSQLCEDLWKGIGTFSGRSTFRTWMYTVARAAMARVRRSTGRREKRQRHMMTWEDAAAEVRSMTAMIQQTAVKDRFTVLRESLVPEEQELLILRIDRQMEWADLARVMSGRDDLEGDELKRESAKLRKRFQSVKERLREMAVNDGLLESE
jgi:RNA polymerase sigma-70 factor (ECF subfamily)